MQNFDGKLATLKYANFNSHKNVPSRITSSKVLLNSKKMFNKNAIKEFVSSFINRFNPNNKQQQQKAITISSSPPKKRLKVATPPPPSQPSLTLISDGNPLLPYGGTLKYLFEIEEEENNERKLVCIDLAYGCIYEVYRLESKKIINVAATNTAIILHVKDDEQKCEFMMLTTLFFGNRLMMLLGYKNDKWKNCLSRMMPKREPEYTKLLYNEMLDELTEKRCLKPLLSKAIINGKGIAATLNSFFLVSHEDGATIIREFCTKNILLKTYHLPFKVIDIAAGLRHVLLLDENGKVYSHGIGVHGELGLGPDIKKFENGFLEIDMLQEQAAPFGIKAIAAGGLHSVALTESGDLYSFGMNEKGALGPGVEDSAVFDPYPVDLSKPVESIRTSLFTTYVFYCDGSYDIFGDSSVPGITELNGMC